MNKHLLCALLVTFFSVNGFAQIPQGFNYQAVIRDGNGQPLSNQSITVKFVIADNMNMGYEFYSEEHVNVMTNEFGMINLVIGEGDVTGDFLFNELNFTDPPFDFLYQLEVYVNIGNGDLLLSESLFESVPYALAAEDVTGGAWKLGGNTIDDGNFIGSLNSKPLKFKAGGSSTKMIIESGTGHIGMGTDNPEVPLDILYNGSAGMRLKSSSSFPTLTLDGNSPGSIYFNDAGSLEWMLTASFNNTDDFVILNPHDNPFIGWTRPFCLQNQTMNVGIKTASPEASLHIQEGVDASLTGNGWLLIGDVDDVNTIYDNNEIMARDNGSTSPLYLNGNGGNVAIGQTSTPSWQLTVNGTAAKPGGGSWTATSDARLKDNVQPFTQGLEEVMEIEPVTYHYIEQTGHDVSVEHVGVIAQDLQKISPAMVSENEMELLDGTVGDYLNVDPSAFTYMLINAVKELQKTNEALQKKIEELSSRLQSLENGR